MTGILRWNVAPRIQVVLCLAIAVLLQATAEGNEYSVFSGTVARIEDKRITVQRATGPKGEMRTFVITEATKVEGELKLSARVTIGFIASEQGDIATRIIVRPQLPKKN